jgi:hypothetical protein
MTDGRDKPGHDGKNVRRFIGRGTTTQACPRNGGGRLRRFNPHNGNRLGR